jgi:hypothetical protein
MMPLRKAFEPVGIPADSGAGAIKLRQNGRIRSRLGLVNAWRIDKIAHLPFGNPLDGLRPIRSTREWGMPGASTA